MDIPEKYKQLWSDWDIRVLILLSLFVQIILFFLGRLRKTSASKWIQMIVWSSYLLADWVADFVLGKLSGAMDDSSSSNAIIAFWAPFLILHLGGPDTITAYSMEDNELWARHLLGLIYELIVAFYVLFRSLPNTRLLAPTILIFLVAIIKYLERSYSLYIASTEIFCSSAMSSTRKRPTNFSSNISNSEDLKALNGAFVLYSACKPFFVDLNPSIKVYQKTNYFFREKTTKEVLTVTGMELSYAYDELYTKATVNHSKVGYALRALCSICILLAFSLYVLEPKDGFVKLDVVITYVLLVASIFLDAMAIIMFLFSDWMLVTLLNVKKLGNMTELLVKYIAKIKKMGIKRRYWSGEMPQLNLISNRLKNFAPNKAPLLERVNRLKEKLSLVPEIKLYPNLLGVFGTCTLHTLQPVQATEELQEIITTYAQTCWFVDYFALQQLTTTLSWIDLSFINRINELPFDAQVLVWHISTDLCFRWKSESLHPLHPHQIEIEAENNKPRGVKSNSSEMEVCKYLSNYMMYMMLMQPNRLRSFRFTNAIYDIVDNFRIFGDDNSLLMPEVKVDQEACREMMINTAIENETLFDIARLLAHLMLCIENEKRWQIATTAWVELLIKEAKNTKAIMHLKQLTKGGELLTFIWLFTKHVGVADAIDDRRYYIRG